MRPLTNVQSEFVQKYNRIKNVNSDIQSVGNNEQTRMATPGLEINANLLASKETVESSKKVRPVTSVTSMRQIKQSG